MRKITVVSIIYLGVCSLLFDKYPEFMNTESNLYMNPITVLGALVVSWLSIATYKLVKLITIKLNH